MAIIISRYFMGRDTVHNTECGTNIRQSAENTASVINRLPDLSARDGVQPGIDPDTGDCVSGGRCPAAANEASGKRGYIPSSALPKCDPLHEQIA